MKYTFTLVLVAFNFLLQSQTPAGDRVHYKSLTDTHSPLRESVIWQETFPDGIPDGWVNEEAGGVAVWEYRGPDTTPSNEVGTRGSCLPVGELGAPIESDSWSDGFIIFDSNWWDDPIGPCGNLGSGDAPGPHLAVLEIPTIDLSLFDKVGIAFTQYTTNYEAEMRVEVSIGGGIWQPVWSNYLIINQETAKDDKVRINISPEAGLQSDVRIRFVFEGLYYFWMIDDVTVLELDANNLFLFDPGYGDFDFFAPDHPTGFEEMEYGLYPDEFAPELKFSAWARNHGADVQTDVGLQVQVIRDADGMMIHDGNSSETFNLQPIGEVELRAGSFQMPGTTGWYSIAYEAYQNEAEESPDDNRDTLHFAITDVTYARDKGPVEGVIIPQDDLSSQPYEIGNVYLATAGGTQAHSISAAISLGSSAGTEIYASLYEFSVDTAITANLLATSETIIITSEMLNDADDLNLVHFVFDSPINLQNGYSYLAVVGCEEGADQMLIGSNGEANEFASWVAFDEDDWFYLTHVPIVRLNIGNITAVNTTEALSKLDLYPNPADMYIQITGTTPGTEYTLQDISGKVVGTGKAIDQSWQLDTGHLPSGIYIFKSETLSQRFIITHPNP